MPDSCAAAECKQSSDQSHVSFFKFPLDPERCKLWVGNCRRPDLQTKTPEFLHANFKLCSRHFDASALLGEGETKTLLRDGAVPTIFDVRKVNAQYSRKRTRARPAANAPVEAKKAKDDPQATPAKENVVGPPAENPGTPAAPLPAEPEKDDPATSKAKEILKIHFKETLAYTGFDVGSSAAMDAAKTLGGGAAGQLGVDPACADRIDPKEVLKLGKAVMCVEIRNCLRMARFFSIVLQDKTDVEGREQIPFFVRTVSGDGFPQKHFLGFLPCELDSDGLFLALISELRNTWRLRMEHCRGFSYLTRGVLCQKLKEVACRMLRDFPQVVLAPSDPYAFNMWLVRSLPVMSVQDAVDTVEEVAALLKRSDTLARKLRFRIAAAYGHVKGAAERVREACRDDWQYGTDAFQTMLDILEPLLGSIGEMCTSTLSEVDASVVEQLLRLREKLRRFDFIVTLVILKNTLCCVSILNLSLRGIISISSTLQYTISNSLKLLGKQLQEIAICHRKWFSDAVGRAKKLGVAVGVPPDAVSNGDGDAEPPPQPSPEDHYRETLTRMILQYLMDEVKRVLGVEMVRILRWLSLVPSYMADHNFSIRKDKVADANLNNLARPDTFYDELGCWEVKWRHASKRRILPTGVFATLKIPDIGFYPNIQSLLRVLGSIPCINADVGVYVGYDLVLDRYGSYLREVPAEKRRCGSAFVYVNQDVHVNADEMVRAYVSDHPDVLQLLLKDDVMEVQPSAMENDANDASKEDLEEPREMTLVMEPERPKPTDRAEADKEALKSALRAALTAAWDSQGGEVEYVTKSEMNEVLKVCEGVVRDGVISEIGNSFFSLFVDRTARFGDSDLLPLFVKFVDSFDVMRMELMGFVEADLDAESLCTRLSDTVTAEWHLDLKYCRGQAYLGSGEVACRLKAFACRVQERYPLAICTHCSCYSFNTWWSRSVPVASVVRALEVLESALVFFGGTPELEKQLDQVLAVGLRESFEKVREFQGNFCSSWLVKHDTYDVFAQILEPLSECLAGFQDSPQVWSSAVINQAEKLLLTVRDFDFIVAVVALKNVSSFTRELSAALQKDYSSAASQLCQIAGIVATLNRLKTNIKVFHQNWFDEACGIAQNLGVPVKVPDNVPVPRDSLLKPAGYYRDAVSVPLVDHLIGSVKDHFSDDHKEALNFLSLVPCSVTTGYTFESLKSKASLYVGDLPDPDNFFTELSCWKVKWKTKVASPSVPDTIFQTLRLPLMQYFSNINTLLKIMSVLPSTAPEYCGEVKRHEAFQDYLRGTQARDRSPCVAMLKVGANFDRDLDRMVTQCLKVTPKTLEGICLDKEAKTLKNPEVKMEDNHKDDVEEMEEQPPRNLPDFNQLKAADDTRTKAAEPMETQQVPEVAAEEVEPENGQTDRPSDNLNSLQTVFRVATRLARRNRPFRELPTEDQELVLQELGACQWDQRNTNHILPDVEILESIVRSIRETVVSEVQESPFFSVITDKVVAVDDRKFVPVFVRYVDDCTPRVELLGFLPFDEEPDAEIQARTLSVILSDEWALQMGCCRGQSFMCTSAAGQGLRKMSLDFLERFPLAVNTPSESCGLAYWLAVSLHNDPITKVLGVVEDLLLFFDQSPRLHAELSQTREGLLNTPREALAEVPETCLSRWKKTEDFFDILVDMLEGVLSCLDSVSGNADASWTNSMSIHALMLSTAIRESDFVISLVILKNSCAPLRSCSTVFRCGNPADIICELERVPLIINTLSKTLENVGAVHRSWFEEATRLAGRVAGTLSYPDAVSAYESAEVGYRETVSIPVLTGLIEEMKFNFSECHLKALKLLSLLPTCNPLPILPEATDKLYAAYRSDLPEPDTVEDEIDAWAAVWREKYQDVQPPASVSETLDHPEAKGHPNVTALLRLVAVLPSISMECDLMKTTVNSLRTLIREDVTCRGSKTSTVMLLMHRQILQSLDQLVNECMERDPSSHGFLSQVKHLLSELKVNSEVCEVPAVERAATDGSSGGSEELNGAVPVVTQEQPETNQPGAEESNTNTLSDTTVTPDDGALEPEASSVPTTMDARSASTVPDGQPDQTEQVVTLELVDAAPDATSQPVTTEPDRPAEDVATEVTATVQFAIPEPSTDLPPRDVKTEPVVSSKDVSVEMMEAAQEITTESPSVAGAVVVEHATEAVDVAHVDAAEPGTEVSMEVTTAAQNVLTEQEETAPIGPEGTSQMEDVTTGPSATAENFVEAAALDTEPVVKVAAQPVTVEPVVAAADVDMDVPAAEMVVQGGTEAEEVTVEHKAEVQGLTTEPVVQTEVQVIAKELAAPPEVLKVVEGTVDHKAEVQDVTAQPEAEMATQEVAKELAAPPEVPEVTSTAAVEETVDHKAEDVTTEPVAEMETQEVAKEPAEPPPTSDEVIVENKAEVQGVTTEAQSVSMELAEESLEVPQVPGTAAVEEAMENKAELQGLTTEPVAEMEAQSVTKELAGESPDGHKEPCTAAVEETVDHKAEVQGGTTESVVQMEAQSVSMEPAEEPPDVPEVRSTPAEEVTMDHKAEVQGVATEPEAQGVTMEIAAPTEPSAAAEAVTVVDSAAVPASNALDDASMEQEVTTTAKDANMKDSVAPPTDGTTDAVKPSPVSSILESSAAAAGSVQSINIEPVAEPATQGVTVKLVEAGQDAHKEDSTSTANEVTKIPATHSSGTQPPSAHLDSTTQLVTAAQVNTTERDTPERSVETRIIKTAPVETVELAPAATQDAQTDHITAAKEVTTEPANVITEVVKPEPTIKEATSDHVVPAQAVLTEETMEVAPAEAQGANKIPTPAACEGTSQHVEATQDVTSETMELTPAKAQSVTTKPVTGAKEVTTDPVVAAQESMEVAPAETQSVREESKTAPKKVSSDPAVAAQDVTQESMEVALAGEHGVREEPKTAPKKVSLDPAVAAQDVTQESMEVAPTEAQRVIKEPEMAPKKVSSDPAVAAQDVTSETIERAQAEVHGVSEEPETAPKKVSSDPAVAAQDVTSETIGRAQAEVHGVSEEPETAPKKVSSDPAVAAQDVTQESMEVAPAGEHGVREEPKTAPKKVSLDPAVAAQDVTSETIEQASAEAHGVREEPETAPKKVSLDPAVAAQDVTSETIGRAQAEVHGVSEEPETAPKKVSSDPAVAAQDVTQESMEVPPTEAHGVREEPETAPKKVSLDPAVAAQDVTSETIERAEAEAEVQGATKKPATEMPTRSPATEPKATEVLTNDLLTTKQNAITEPVTLAQEGSTESAPTTAQGAISEPPAAVQNKAPSEDTSMRDASMEPQECKAAKPSPPLSETMQPETQNISTDPMSAPQAVTTEAVSEIESTAMDHTASPDIITTPATTKDVTTKSTPTNSVVEHKSVAKDPTEDAQASSVDPTLTPQDVPMETVTASEDMTTKPVEPVQDVSMEPVREAQGASAEPKEVAQDVTMEPDTDVQDEPMDTTDDQDGSSEPVASSVHTDPEVQSHEVTAAPAIPNSGSADVCEAKAPCQDAAVDGSAQAVNGVTGHVTQAVQDVIDQSGQAAQDGTESLKSVAQAGQDELHQPVQDAQGGIAPSKGVLSFYAYPSQEAFLSELEDSKYFSITYEPHVEIEGHIYIPVGVCYLEKNEKLCEDVLAYVPLDEDLGVFVDSMTAALSEKWGLNLAHCRGQSLLTVGATVAHVKAAAALFSQRYPLAVCTFNNSVSLNTWLARSCVEISDSYLWVESLLQWMTDDAEKQARVHRTITSLYQNDERKQSELRLRLSRNQWDRSHDTIDFTVEVLQAIILCLSEMKESTDTQVDATQAANFLCILQNFELILILVVMKNILGLTKDLSQSLQGEPLDMYQALNTLPGLISSLKDVTTNLDSYLQAWYQEAVVLSEKLQIGVDPTSQESLILHYRDVVSKGAIEHSVSEMSQLFSDRVQSVLCCTQVVPYVLSKVDGCCTDSDLFKVYQDDLPEWNSLQEELRTWREKWRGAVSAQLPLPKGFLDTFKTLDAKSFPNIETLLRLLMVLPCCKREDSIRQGKMSLMEFNQQKSLLELYPL
ncbi:uncharacterized protein si:dkey-250d21.1 isoform X2 [Trichomycterus rosablanca]|uniref:uncharacterized protein si:dkey-250d21.1 isoform X2 n=1 Tax=Trichomycterus rosablanca TaxID=2290929 RepID=UPI002F3516DC